MTYAENKRRVLAAAIAAILVLAVGMLLGTAVIGTSGIPAAKLTAVQAQARTLAYQLATSEQTLTTSQASARTTHAQLRNLSHRTQRLQRQTAKLTARIRAARHCLAIDRRTAHRCVAKALH